MSDAHTGYYNGSWYGGGRVNTSEMMNREKKARKMAAVLFKARITVEELANATPEEWGTIAASADCRPPHSQETIALVVSYLTMAYHDETINQLVEDEPKSAQQEADEAAAADDKAEAKWHEQQMEETGADRTPGRE